MIPLAQAIAAAQSIHKLGSIYPSAAKIKQARLALEAAAKAKGKRPPKKPKSTFKAVRRRLVNLGERNEPKHMD